MSEPLVKPRHRSPHDAVHEVAVMARTLQGVERDPGFGPGVWEHRWPRGRGGALTGRILTVRNVETQSGSSQLAGSPTVRKGELPGWTGRPKKRKPTTER